DREGVGRDLGVGFDVRLELGVNIVDVHQGGWNRAPERIGRQNSAVRPWVQGQFRQNGWAAEQDMVTRMCLDLAPEIGALKGVLIQRIADVDTTQGISLGLENR